MGGSLPDGDLGRLTAVSDQPDLPAGVTTAHTRDSVSATTSVAAPPAEVFAFLRRPANHAIISGDTSVKETTVGPDELSEGDRFGMRMKMYGLPYKITSKVVEYEADRRIAWCHLGGHRWRWEVADDGAGGSTVTETFDMSTARFPPALRLMGYPKGHEANVARSVANLAEHLGRA